LPDAGSGKATRQGGGPSPDQTWADFHHSTFFLLHSPLGVGVQVGQGEKLVAGSCDTVFQSQPVEQCALGLLLAGQVLLEAQHFPDFALDGLLPFPAHQSLARMQFRLFERVDVIALEGMAFPSAKRSCGNG
jgi:hypothetical protein